jgi:hypothetical protein
MLLRYDRHADGSISINLPVLRHDPRCLGLNGSEISALAGWPAELQIEYHELAAFLEFDCGLERAAANNEAFHRQVPRLDHYLRCKTFASACKLTRQRSCAVPRVGL